MAVRQNGTAWNTRIQNPRRPDRVTNTIVEEDEVVEELLRKRMTKTSITSSVKPSIKAPAKPEVSPTAEFGGRPVAVFSFVSHAQTQRVSYREQKYQLLRALQQSGHFEDGCVLETMEKGVLFPAVHFAPSIVSVKKRLKAGGPMHSGALGPNFVLHQGIYTEVNAFSPNETKLSKDSDDVDDTSTRAYIVVGFKSLDRTFSKVLEDTWKDWSGARYIYLNLSINFKLCNMRFFRRMKPDNLDLFMYILVVECDNVTPQNKVRMLDFIQRMRVERMNGYVSIYTERTGDGDSSYYSAESLNGTTSPDLDASVRPKKP